METRMLNAPRKRLSKKTLAMFTKGVRTPEEIIKAITALGADLAAGKLQTKEFVVICRLMKINLRAKRPQLRHDALDIRRARIEIESIRRTAVKPRVRS
jgi:hypothetical protein